MRRTCILGILGLSLAACAARAGDQFTVTATNRPAMARAAEVIVVPWAEVAARIPGALMYRVEVLDGSGRRIPAQVTHFEPDNRKGGADQLLFQHDFAAGETRAVFTVERASLPVPPFPSRTFARYVPERLDDFAWENDRIAHRTYGYGLETPAAGISQMVSSGLDVWSKRVRYLVVDRWYLEGHDIYHQDHGEGLDMYDTGQSRGCGGTGIWDGHALHASHNYRHWKVLANGPLRSVFELAFDPWDAGGGVMVSETKRFTIDAGHNLDEIQSTFTFANSSGELTVGIGLGKHPKAQARVTLRPDSGLLSLWERYARDGQLGTAIVISPRDFAGSAEDAYNHLLLVRVRSGVPIRYFAGAGWDRSGDFGSETDWNAYLYSWAARLRSPVTIAYGGTGS